MTHFLQETQTQNSLMSFGIFKIFNALLVVVAAGVLFLFTSGNESDTLKHSEPCSEPLTFQVGDIDDRFQVSEAELADLLESISETWSEAADKTVMKYADDGEIRVNLVYDNEQQMTDSERQYRDRLRREEQEISRLEAEYERMNNRFDEKSADYQDDSAELQQEIDGLNAWVNEQNSAGGFYDDDLERFEERKTEIDQKAINLNGRAEQLMAEADELNRFLDEINKKIDHKNNLIKEYNQTFSGVQRFTQGTYEWKGDDRWINVFQFSSHRELELVIAHEMGHAIGIDHVSNPESVMHHLMGNQSGTTLQLSEEDVRALNNICSSGNE